MTLQNNIYSDFVYTMKNRGYLYNGKKKKLKILTVVIVIMDARIITVGMNVKSFGRKMCELRKITTTISILLVIVSQ